MERHVIHLNVADFAVAVERVVDARLRGRPVIIAPPGAARAHVLDMSDEAYRAGVRKGMSLAQARAACRDAQLVPPHADRYERAMREFLARALPFSPLIELVDENGHLFLDVTGTGRLFGPPMDIAWRIRKETRVRLGFDPIWAVGSNKLVAKVATRLVKPTGEYIVEPGAEEEFLRPLPLALLPGLERDDLLRLREFHLRRVADVTRLTLPQLEVALGGPDAARSLYEAARGVDRSPVWPVAGPRPIVVADRGFGLNGSAEYGVRSAEHGGPAARSGFNVPGSGLTASRGAQLETLNSKCETGVVVQSAIRNPQSAIAEADTNDVATVEGALYALAEQAGAELRRRKLAARRVGVVLDYSDGVRLARSAAAGTATANDFRLFALGQDALAHAWTRRVRVRHLRLVCDRLIFPPAQLELFPEEAERTRREEGLVAALDAIRARFGAGAIRVGRVLAAPA